MLPLEHKHGALYRQALLLAKAVYHLTDSFPDTERTVLTYTLRRQVVLLCEQLATAGLKRGKKQRRCFEACREQCVALDAQLELAVAVNSATEAGAQEVVEALQTLYKSITQVAGAGGS